MSEIAKSLDTLYRKFKVLLYEKSLQDVGSGKDDALSLQEVVYMEIIVALSDPTVRTFAEHAKLSDPNAAYRVQQLIKKGYVTKVQSRNDRREFHLVATDKYSRKIGLFTDYIEMVSRRVEEHFPKEDVDKMSEMLNVICTELTPELEDRLVNIH